MSIFSILQSSKFALLPKLSGYIGADRNTGFAPIYSPLGNVTAQMNNMLSGYGFIYNSGDPYYLNDGANDSIVSNDQEAESNTSTHSIVLWVVWDGVAATQNVIGNREDGSNFWRVFIDGTGSIVYNFRVGGTDKRATTSTMIGAATRSLVACVKDGSSLKVYINGNEATYSGQDAYALGNKSWGDTILTNYIFDTNGGLTSKCEGLMITNDVLTLSDIADLYTAGPTFGGLEGYYISDGVMGIREPSTASKTAYSNRPSLYVGVGL